MGRPRERISRRTLCNKICRLAGIIKRADPESIKLSKHELMMLAAYLEATNRELRSDAQE